jgi:methyl-accepting chemotaxis protein
MNNVTPKNIEYVLTEQDSAVTRTDLNRVITYACPDFVRISGYSEKELIGTSHAIVHHADMPKEPFTDLWECLKAQQPWVGLIKNLRKDGSYFWAITNIIPDYENGKHIGYIAVRKKADPQQIQRAENAYRLIKQGSKNFKIERGEIIENSFMRRFDFFKMASIKTRIISVISLLATLFLIASASGLYNVDKSNDSLRVVYEDREIPLYQISSIQKLLLQNRILITACIVDSGLIQTNTAQLEKNIAAITELWKTYTSKALSPEEKALADEFAANRKQFVQQGLLPTVAALRSGNSEQAKELVITKIRPIFTTVSEDIETLSQFEMSESDKLYKSAQSRFTQSMQMMMTLLISGFSLSFFMGLTLYRAIVRPLEMTSDLIIRGDNKNLVQTKEGSAEIVNVLNSFKVSQVKSSFNEAQAKRTADENLRIRIALDNVSTGVMVCDNTRKIIYANKSVEQVFSYIEKDIQQEIPNFMAKNLMGRYVDEFQRTVQHTENLNNLNGHLEMEITLGGHPIFVSANAVINEQGERLGVVAEWRDRTEEVAIEQEVAQVIRAISQGDFSRRIDENGKEDFLLVASKGINSLIETCSGSLNEIVRVLSALSHGDLTQKVQNDYAGMFEQMKTDANATVDSLREIVQQIKEATENVNIGAKEIAAGNNDLSQRTEKQAASLEETAASMEELTSTVRNNAENAKQANQLALDATGIAQRGVDVVSQVVKTMDEINDSSRKIGDIISVIDDIAFQTNILALNAAVEAARAGDQGKGFAVVAVEVRNLAQRAATAAGEIKNLIDDSVIRVNGGSKLVTNAGDTMGEIVASIRGVTSMMSEITSASSEQSEGIEQVNKAVGQMDEVTQQNAALVEESAAAAEALEDQARNLLVSVSHFKTGNEHRYTSSTNNAKKSVKSTTLAVVKKANPVVNASSEWEEF